MKKVTLGLLRETKTPNDRRTPLPPAQAQLLLKQFPQVELYVQQSPIRAYTDDEYRQAGIPVVESLEHCDLLLGVKEVQIDTLLPGKSYLFFSHTAKKQDDNKALLKAILDKNITLIDYEYLTDSDGQRLVAFGRWAGIVGAYNALLGYGLRSGRYQLKRAHACYDMDEVRRELTKVQLPHDFKIVMTGGGRVAHGAMEILDQVGLQKVSPQQLLHQSFDRAVYAQVDPWHYVRRRNGQQFDLGHYFKYGHEYESAFEPYTRAADLYITAHYWSKGYPDFMTWDQIRQADFRLQMIADISCDLHGPIPTTLRASSIAEPFYGVDRHTGTETEAFAPEALTVMAVDNLPGEAPRSASIDFGQDLIRTTFPALLGSDTEGIIRRATIAQAGGLCPAFEYLTDWVHSPATF